MATTLSILPITPKLYFTPKFKSFQIKPHNFTTSNITPQCSSTSQSSNNSPTPPSTSQFHTFLTNNELTTLTFLQNYAYSINLPPSGQLLIRPMSELELDSVAELLSESFADSMSMSIIFIMPEMYVKLLGYLVKQYLFERRGLVPHNVTLVGVLGDSERDFRELVGTVEVCFDSKGANSNPPTPTAPKNCPYVCNMTVRKEFRRRGIGWHLLKASEELISYMTSTRDVYLHCRLIDTAPFTMYKKAGYEVVKTDSFLVLLTLQRRKHLMCKRIPNLRKPLETVITEDEEEASSLLVESETEPLLFDEVVQNSPEMDK